MSVIETKNLTKNYGDVCAVNSVNLHLEPGKVYALIGKNGAGKTTILKMITNLAIPTMGEVMMDPDTVRIGALIEKPGLYGSLSCYQNLKIRMLAAGSFTEDRCLALLELVGLLSVKKRKAKALSLGMKQRLGIAIALSGNPNVLILDEPINGLDPEGILDVRNLIIRLQKERNMTVLISSHILTELEKITDTYGILDHGVLLEEVSKEALTVPIEEHFMALTSGNGGVEL